MLLSGFYLYLSPRLPSVESIRDYPLQIPLRIYSADAKLLGEFGEKRRKPVVFADIPKQFLDALIATEDADFYSHNGVSVRGLFRAVTHLITTGRKGPGGSTLTMQLTRHVFLTLDQTFLRKFNEILLAIQIEKELSKEEIIELYVNLMNFGKRAYGIEAAAETYYGKSIGALSLAQHAMIVGILKGPTSQNPINNLPKALERRDYILGRMLKLDFINVKQHRISISEPASAQLYGQKIEVNAPYVAEMARKKITRIYGTKAYTEGYQVFTTIDSKLQQRAQSAVINGLLTYDQRHGYRGPEQKLDLTQAPILGAEATSLTTSQDTVPRDYRKWSESLAAIPVYGELQPAAITEVGEQSITALLPSSSLVVLNWEDGLADARPYVNENMRGPRPSNAAEILAVGDVVRLRQTRGEEWELSQLPEVQGSLVALSPENGAILSMVGGFDFNHSNFNRATQAQRQPGSNMKPFIYTAALENGLTPATIINDAPIVFDDKQLETTWRPENSSNKYNGPTRLREALFRSVNVVSIRVLDRIGIDNAIHTLEKFGFDPQALPRDLSLALGTHAVTPLDIASGYATFANGGYRVEPYLVEKIADVNDDIIYHAAPKTVCSDCEEGEIKTKEAKVSDTLAEIAVSPLMEMIDNNYTGKTDPFWLSFKTKQQLEILKAEDFPRAPKILSDQIAFIMDSMLKDVIRRGTGVRAKKALKRPDIAGKTGTTNGPLDAWFSGYHPSVVASTWVGFDQNFSLGKREYGGTAALPVWIDFMALPLADKPVLSRIQPPGVISIKIDPETGKRARIDDPDAIFEFFMSDNTPDPYEDSQGSAGSTNDPFNQDIF